MRLSFHGADRDVTGSCHLLECVGRHILIDCGMLQGSRELARKNAEPFGFDPAAIDFVLLTHAHLDHCGRLPLLVKRGFRGEVIATSATRELVRLVLMDAAHLQEEEARHASRQRRRHGDDTAPEPLYSLLDAMSTLDQFGRAAEYNAPIELAPGLRAMFFDAGHILGSASILVEAVENGESRSILFSGDIGNAGRPLLRAPATPPRPRSSSWNRPTAIGCIAPMTGINRRTLWRDRGHIRARRQRDRSDVRARARAGNFVFPASGNRSKQNSSGGAGLPRFAHGDFGDSKSSSIIPNASNRRSRDSFRTGAIPSTCQSCISTRETADSIAINRVSGGAIIMAGAGMCTGGRVRHHLRHNLWRQESSVIFVGFAAVGTLARQIIDGARSVNLFGEDSSGARAHSYHQRFFGACRSARAHRLAPQDSG